jgi:hypothetical protein
VPTQLAGAWSSYRYNRAIFESSITEGVNVFRYTEPSFNRRSLRLHHLNPQTQEFSIRPGSAEGDEPDDDYVPND